MSSNFRLLLRKTIPIALTNNNEGRTKHFGASHSKRKKYEKLLRGLGFVREPFTVPTVVRVIRVLGKRQSKWDYSSGFRGNWKEIEDVLVQLGWWKDDGPNYITGCYFDQDDTQRENGPCIIVEVYEMIDSNVGVFDT